MGYTNCAAVRAAAKWRATFRFSRDSLVILARVDLEARGLAQFHNLMLFPEEVESLTARLKNWRPAEGSSRGGDSREDGAVPPNFTEEELDEHVTKPLYAMLGV